MKFPFARDSDRARGLGGINDRRTIPRVAHPVARGTAAAMQSGIQSNLVFRLCPAASIAAELHFARSDFSQSITSLFTHRFLCSRRSLRYPRGPGAVITFAPCGAARRDGGCKAFRILLTEFHRSRVCRCDRAIETARDCRHAYKRALGRETARRDDYLFFFERLIKLRARRCK